MIIQIHQLSLQLEYMGKQYGQRPGQWFVNKYISQPWPELYYCEDAFECAILVYNWMMDQCYNSLDEIPEAKTGSYYA
jgi:hypothetical protein